MPQPISRAAQAALLKWVNTFPLDRRVDRLEDLADGHVFAQMLQDIDPEYDPAELEQNTGPSAWLIKKRNIQSVFKALTKYIIHKDTGGQIDFLPRTVDLRAISDKLDPDGISQLIAIFAAAAMMGDHNTKYIPIMTQSLSTGEQAEIMTVLQQKNEERERLASAGADESMTRAAGRPVDPDLEAEAELATLAAESDRLRKQCADLNTRLEHLQIAYERLKDDHERTQTQLEMERQNHGASESQMIKDLYNKIREQDELISNQEAQVEDDRQTKQRLTQENFQLSRKAELAQQLQDQVQELKHSNDELTKKANTADRYKQKLEAQRGMETDLQNALYELSQTRESLREFESLQSRCSQQATTIERFRTMVATLEQQLEDNRIKRVALEDDIYSVQSQLDHVKEQKALDEARIAELEQQVLHGAGFSSSASPGASKTAFNLEEELQHTADPTAAYNLEISRLRAENNLLRNNMGVGSENDRLRAELEDAKTRETLLQEKYNAIFAKHTMDQEQIQALANGAASAGNQALSSLRKTLQETTTELGKQRVRTQELEDQAGDRDRELLGLKADLNAVEKGSLDALDELKSTDKLISASLQNELEGLRKQHKTLQLDYDQQKTQLIDALLSKDRLRKEVDESSKETALASPTVANAAGSVLDQAAVDELVRKSNEKLAKLGARVKQQKEQIEKADQERYELQRRLKAAEQGGASAAQKAAHDQIIKSLQRENAMIATAWYDLTSRLQSNHVVLQRRQDMPKSWLNKQRQMVNGKLLADPLQRMADKLTRTSHTAEIGASRLVCMAVQDTQLTGQDPEGVFLVL